MLPVPKFVKTCRGNRSDFLTNAKGFNSFSSSKQQKPTPEIVNGTALALHIISLIDRTFGPPVPTGRYALVVNWVPQDENFTLKDKSLDTGEHGKFVDSRKQTYEATIAAIETIPTRSFERSFVAVSRRSRSPPPSEHDRELVRRSGVHWSDALLAVPRLRNVQRRGERSRRHLQGNPRHVLNTFEIGFNRSRALERGLLLYSFHMIPAGIILLVLGLGLFIGAGIKLDDYPGVERNHVIVMLVGLVCILVGGILLYAKVFGG